MHAFFHFFARNQLIEDRKDLLTILVNRLELFLNGEFVTMPLKKLVHQFAGQFDIAAQRFGRVAAQEETIEQRGFALRCEGIEILDHPRTFGNLWRRHQFTRKRPHQKQKYKRVRADLQ